MLNQYLERLKIAARTLKDGGVVIIATETFYCMAADPFVGEAVDRIFELKSRSYDKPLPLIASSVERVWAVISEESRDAFELACRFWPGSLTMLLNLNLSFPACLTGSGGRVGVRVPTDCPASELAAMGSGWITATSANLAGGPNASEIEQIPAALLNSVDFVVDTGPTPGGLPSTVMALEGGLPVIHRNGAVSMEAISHALGLEIDKST